MFVFALHFLKCCIIFYELVEARLEQFWMVWHAQRIDDIVCDPFHTSVPFYYHISPYIGIWMNNNIQLFVWIQLHIHILPQIL